MSRGSRCNSHRFEGLFLASHGDYTPFRGRWSSSHGFSAHPLLHGIDRGPPRAPRVFHSSDSWSLRRMRVKVSWLAFLQHLCEAGLKHRAGGPKGCHGGPDTTARGTRVQPLPF